MSEVASTTPQTPEDRAVQEAYKKGLEQAAKDIPHAMALDAPPNGSRRVRLVTKLDQLDGELRAARRNVEERADTLLHARKHEATMKAYRDHVVGLLRGELP